MCNKNGYSLKEVRTVLNEVKRIKVKSIGESQDITYVLCVIPII
jgi:hypothetical protein